MRSTTRRFMAKIGAVLLGILTFLLLDAALSGVLPLVGALCLIPACAYVTLALGEMALRPKRRSRAARRVAAQRRATATHMARPAPVASVGSHLRVVPGGQKPENKPPHAA